MRENSPGTSLVSKSCPESRGCFVTREEQWEQAYPGMWASYQGYNDNRMGRTLLNVDSITTLAFDHPTLPKQKERKYIIKEDGMTEKRQPIQPRLVTKMRQKRLSSSAASGFCELALSTNHIRTKT